MIAAVWALAFVASVGLGTFYGAALAAFATLGRWLEQRDAPPTQGLAGRILGDAETVMAAWFVGGFFFGLAAVLALAHLVASLAEPPLHPVATMLVSLLLGTLSLLGGLLLWKRWAEAAPHAYTVVAAVLVLPVYVFLFPLRRWLGTALSRLYPPFTRRAGVLFADDVEAMTANGERARLLDEDEREMIQRVFLLGETVVREIMVPRIDMVAVDESTPVPEIVQLLQDKRHSRVPVYHENVDNIVGFLHIKDLVAHLEELDRLQLAQIIRPAFFVPETKLADDLLSEMRARRMHLAIVVDEYGGTAGLVTLEDVIEEVVGEIQDETDREQPLISRLADGSFRIDAKVDLDVVNERLGVELPADDFHTLGGLLYGLAGKIPVAGNRFKFSGLEFVIAAVRGKRITQVLVRALEPQALDEAQ